MEWSYFLFSKEGKIFCSLGALCSALIFSFCPFDALSSYLHHIQIVGICIVSLCVITLICQNSEKYYLNRFFSRLTQVASLSYITLLILLSYNTISTVRSWVVRYGGGPIAEIEKNYAYNCDLIVFEKGRVTVPHLKEKIDIFITAHLVGWIVKTIVIRDMGLLWILSVLFEWMEVTFRHILPNFWECWWDHLLLDIFGCNLLGIYIGLTIVKRCNIKRYNWYWRRGYPSNGPWENHEPRNISSKNRKALPTEKYNWMSVGIKKLYFLRNRYCHPMFSSIQICVILLCFIFLATAIDVNLFFIKAQLGIAPSHWMILTRTALVTFAALFGTRDLYAFVSEPHHRTLGLQAILNIGIFLAEFFVIMRFRYSLPPHEAMPQLVQRVWIFLATFVSVVGVLVSVLPGYDTQLQRNKYR